MSDDQLGELWSNAARMLLDPTRHRQHQAANETHDAVELEWKRRCTNANWFTHKPTEEPEDGMLKAFGYHVGETKRVSDRLRQMILIWIVERALPPVGSPYYLKQWGEPTSTQRLEKLARTLYNLSQREESRKHPARIAAQQRIKDLKFLKNRYYARGSESAFPWPI